MERQGERALECPPRPGELALITVRGEELERVRPDLRLDPLRAKRRKRLVAAVEADDVRLPAVGVARLGGGQLDEPGQALRVRLGDAPAGGEQLVEPAQLRDPDGAEDVREPVVEPRRADLERAARLDAVVAQAARPRPRAPGRSSSPRRPRRS